MKRFFRNHYIHSSFIPMKRELDLSFHHSNLSFNRSAVLSKSSTSFRKNFPGMPFPKNRISISLKPSPRKLDCPAFPNYHYLEQPHLPSHTRRADFERYLWAQAVSQGLVGNGGPSRTPLLNNDMEKKSRKKRALKIFERY